MTETSKIDVKALEAEFLQRAPRYDKLAKTLLTVLVGAMREAGIELFNAYYRIKDFQSFRDKAERNNYTEPFNQTEDICGLRIVHYYKSDLDKILSIIGAVANVVQTFDKNAAQETERFGYRAVRLIIGVKEEWLTKPELADLKGLQAEIQVRTVVMDTWSKIEQQMAYERKEHIDDRFRRKFSQLAAFFDLADDMFDELRIEKARYADNIAAKAKAAGGFDPRLPMNLDNLQAFLDFYFPKRKKNLKHVSWLLVNIILPHNISMEELVGACEMVKPHLADIEKGLTDIMQERYFFKEKEFERTQGIMLMTILSLTSADYWKIIANLFDERYWESLLQFFNTWRGKIAEKAE